MRGFHIFDTSLAEFKLIICIVRITTEHILLVYLFGNHLLIKNEE